MGITINTLFVGKVLLRFETLPSTNEYALNLLSKNNPSEGTVIITDNQYAGKGQIDTKWESEPNQNLTFSTVLYPHFLLAQQQFYLNQAITLGLLYALDELIPNRVTVKWPNDLYVSNKKIAGILIQNTLRGMTLQASVIGIGLNVNQIAFKKDSGNPTSVLLEIGEKQDLEFLLNRICYHIECYYLHLKAGKLDLLRQKYMQHLYRKGMPHVFKRADGSSFIGIIQKVTHEGKLLIASDKGEECFSFKEIKYVI